MEFIEILEELLDDEEISMKELSNRIGVHNSVLYLYRNNNVLPSVKTAVKIANYYDCSLNFLMGLEIREKMCDYNFDYDCSKFYPRYSQLLKINDITHNALCDKISLNHSSLTLWKKGSVPNMDSLIKIAKYFDVSIDYLVGRSDEC